MRLMRRIMVEVHLCSQYIKSHWYSDCAAAPKPAETGLIPVWDTILLKFLSKTPFGGGKPFNIILTNKN